jgi:putative heme-binding domain-containing protein
MKSQWMFGAVLCLAAAVGALTALLHDHAVAGPPAKRVSWTASKVHGTSEPPHPYRVERVFPKLTFNEPVFLAHAPGISRWFLGERFGKIYSFPKNNDVEKADLVLDLKKDIHSWDAKSNIKSVGECYALAFHPQFVKNRYCYVCYILQAKNGQDLPDGTRISRFRVTDTDPPRIDPASETVLLTFLGGGHNGCDLHFGNDGYLYISTGDGSGPFPPDARDTGQDLSDLLSSILRIDVDRTEKGKNYAIPKDNPFVDLPKARPEIYAYGFRNPWRMSFDRPTGDLWVGDVGWESWEMVYRVQKGGNYGWSVKEGRQDVKPNGRRGPTPILPPTLDFPHTEAASITGGYVYHGKRFPELQGAYICGDWVTRKLWATKFDGDRIVWHKEIAHGDQRVVGFGEDTDGELLFLHHDERGSIHTLVPNEAAVGYRDIFPRKLSQTGLFANAAEHRLAAGVVPYEVNAARWADHAVAERFLAIPVSGTAMLFDNWRRLEAEFYGSYFFPPAETVLGETLAIDMERGNPKTRKRLETQILHFDGKTWRGYSYLWNDAGTDADLVDSKGTNLTLNIADRSAPEGKRRQTWHVPSRGECMTCHNPWSGFALSMTPHQLDRDVVVAGKKSNQIDLFRQLGLIELKHRAGDLDASFSGPLPEPLVDPYSSGDLERRTRSYLHVNCSHCHQFGAGGTALVDFRITRELERAKTIGDNPVQGNFGIEGAKVVAPGDPVHSILYYRMAKVGRGRMPHLGSEVVDESAVRLMHDWIRSLPPDAEAWKLLQKLRSLDEAVAVEREKREAADEIAELAQRYARWDRRPEPNADDVRRAEAEYAKRTGNGAKERPRQRTEVLRKLLASPSLALITMRELAEGRISAAVRPELVKLAMQSNDPLVRDLFERFAPDSQRVERLGTQIDPAKLLAFTGDVGRGRELFFGTMFQCGNCHTVGGKGGQIGPDLTQLTTRLKPAQIVESILEPSKTIDPKYLTYNAETNAGVLHTGLLITKSDKEIVLRPITGKDVRILAAELVALQAQKTSLMPDNLLRDATPQQAGDLLAFLRSLK